MGPGTIARRGVVRSEVGCGLRDVFCRINFNRYFYKYQPPKPLEEIEADIKRVEGEILELLREEAG